MNIFMGILYFLAIAVGAYLLGGLNGALITSRLVYKEDIREHGSGNPGLTNFLRTYGTRSVFLVILIDVLKTALPVVMGGTILGNALSFGTIDERIMIGRTLGGLFAMVGHAYPCFDKFKGGKAVLAGGTAAIFIDLRVAAVVFGVFILAVAITRYVSLGSVLAGIAFPTSFFIFNLGLWAGIIAICGGALIVFRHGENIKRLFKGEESKLSIGKRGTE